MMSTNRIGQTLGGRYQIVRSIGEGGMGVVYEAVQLGLGRRVAVKLVSRTDRDRAGALARFRREAEAAAALGHPNIVQVTDFIDAGDGQPFIVMELVEGESLRSIIDRENRLEPARVCFIATQVLSALSATHRAGIVHRDIKPGNIVITRTAAIRDFVKVVDFGIAKLHAAGVPPSGDSTVIGTPSYMAPEQSTGADVDARADIYGVAATMLKALTGHAPPKPPVPPVALLAPWLPPLLADVLDRALAMNPLARYASADAMIHALAPFVSAHGGAAPASTFSGGGPPTAPTEGATASERTMAPPPAPPPLSRSYAGPQVHAPPAPPRTPSSTGWVVGIVAGGSLLLLLLGGGATAAYFFAQRDATGPTPATSGTTAATVTTGTPSSTATGKATTTATTTGRPSGGTKTTPTATASAAAVDAGAVVPVVVDAGTAPPTKRRLSMDLFRGDAYESSWVRKKLATPAFAACFDQSFFDPALDREAIWTVAFDPTGEVHEVYYRALHRTSVTNAELRACGKAAMVGTKLGASSRPGSGSFELLVTVR